MCMHRLMGISKLVLHILALPIQSVRIHRLIGCGLHLHLFVHRRDLCMCRLTKIINNAGLLPATWDSSSMVELAAHNCLGAGPIPAYPTSPIGHT